MAIINCTKRVLIVFWDRIGEIIARLNILEALHVARADISITVVCGEIGIRLLKNNPYVDELIPIDSSIYNKILKKAPYDLVIDFLYRKVSHKIISFSRAPYIIWYNSAAGLLSHPHLDTLELSDISGKDKKFLESCYYFNKRDNYYICRKHLSLKHKISLDMLFRRGNLEYLSGPFFQGAKAGFSGKKRIELWKGHNILDVNNAIILYLGGHLRKRFWPKIYLSKAERDFADRFIQDIGIQYDSAKKPIIIGLHPGTGSFKRIWSEANYARLGKGLLKRYDAKILIFQGPSEEVAANRVSNLIADSHKTICVPLLELRKYLSIVSKCNLFITNDGGPMHLAAALDVPLVGIFVNSNPNYWFLYSGKPRCYFVCPDFKSSRTNKIRNTKNRLRINEILINDVFEKAARILEG